MHYRYPNLLNRSLLNLGSRFTKSKVPQRETGSVKRETGLVKRETGLVKRETGLVNRMNVYMLITLYKCGSNSDQKKLSPGNKVHWKLA